jgi:hypothetical protein
MMRHETARKAARCPSLAGCATAAPLCGAPRQRAAGGSQRVVPVALHPEEIAALRVLGYLHRDDAPDAAGLGALFGGCSPGSGRRKRGRADKGVRTRVALVADPPAGSGRRRPHPRTGRIATARRPGRPQVPASSYRRGRPGSSRRTSPAQRGPGKRPEWRRYDPPRTSRGGDSVVVAGVVNATLFTDYRGGVIEVPWPKVGSAHVGAGSAICCCT